MNIAIILSGGTGTRLGGDIPKQYMEVSEKPMISYVLDTFLWHKDIDGIQVVADERWHMLIKKCIGWIETKCPIADDSIGEKNRCGQNTTFRCIDGKIGGMCTKYVGFSSPGDNRQTSILNALRDIKYSNLQTNGMNIIIQDAVRPLTSVQLIDTILEALNKHEAATPTLPIKDTVYYVDEDGRFTGNANRSMLVAGQAPEGFRFDKYLAATEALLPQKIYEVTGSLQTALLYGMDAVAVPGDENNFKVTTRDDLEKLRMIVEQKNKELSPMS